MKRRAISLSRPRCRLAVLFGGADVVQGLVHAEALPLLKTALSAEKDRVTEFIGESVRERMQTWIRACRPEDLDGVGTLVPISRTESPE